MSTKDILGYLQNEYKSSPSEASFEVFKQGAENQAFDLKEDRENNKATTKLVTKTAIAALAVSVLTGQALPAVLTAVAFAVYKVKEAQADSRISGELGMVNRSINNELFRSAKNADGSNFDIESRSNMERHGALLSEDEIADHESDVSRRFGAFSAG